MQDCLAVDSKHKLRKNLSKFVFLVGLYVTFKQKEKMAILKKIRDTQRNLPVYNFKYANILGAPRFVGETVTVNIIHVEKEAKNLYIYGLFSKLKELRSIEDSKMVNFWCTLPQKLNKKNLWRRKCVRRTIFRNVAPPSTLTLFATRPTVSLCDLSRVILHQK